MDGDILQVPPSCWLVFNIALASSHLTVLKVLAGPREGQTWPALPPTPTPNSASVWINNYLEIIFLGLKHWWEQMGYELGIWGWGRYLLPLPPHPDLLKGPLRCGGPVRDQEESIRETHNGSRRRKGRGSLRPSRQGKGALAVYTSSFLRSQHL